MKDKCEEMVRDSGGFRFGTCWRTTSLQEIDGKTLCGLHAAAVKRRKANDERRRRESSAREERYEKSDQRRDALGMGSCCSDGGVKLSAAEADALIERLKRAEEDS